MYFPLIEVSGEIRPLHAARDAPRPLGAKAGPTDCARLFSGTGFSREEAGAGNGNRWCLSEVRRGDVEKVLRSIQRTGFVRSDCQDERQDAVSSDGLFSRYPCVQGGLLRLRRIGYGPGSVAFAPHEVGIDDTPFAHSPNGQRTPCGAVVVHGFCRVGS